MEYTTSPRRYVETMSMLSDIVYAATPLGEPMTECIVTSINFNITRYHCLA